MGWLLWFAGTRRPGQGRSLAPHDPLRSGQGGLPRCARPHRAVAAMGTRLVTASSATCRHEIQGQEVRGAAHEPSAAHSGAVPGGRARSTGQDLVFTALAPEGRGLRPGQGRRRPRGPRNGGWGRTMCPMLHGHGAEEGVGPINGGGACRGTGAMVGVAGVSGLAGVELSGVCKDRVPHAGSGWILWSL